MVKKIGKYELRKTLGTGTFGKVKYAIDTQDEARTAYAIKVLDRKQIEKEQMQEQLKNEVAIMKMLNHPHVVKMFEVIQSPQHIYIVLEIVTGGELFDRIVAAKRFDEPTARRYFQQLMFGVYYCHAQGVAHRDLKPENLLLDASDGLKISDFGLSSFSQTEGKDKMLMTTCGTPNYVAPEVLKEKGYNGLFTDIWSCGVILFVMLAGHLPFEDATTNGLFIKIERGEYRMPKNFAAPVKNLIAKILTVDPNARITLKAITEDPWFTTGLTPAEIEKQMNVGTKVETNGPSAFAEATESTVGVNPVSDRKDLTAFELASQLIMGSLSPLVAQDNMHIRRNTQFLANGVMATVIGHISKELEQMNAKPAPAKTGDAIKGYLNTSKGIVTFNFACLPTVCTELIMVECRRMRGDTLEFQKFYRDVVGRLKEIVPQQPSPAAQNDEGDEIHSISLSN